jgi:hypothetical protein
MIDFYLVSDDTENILKSIDLLNEDGTPRDSTVLYDYIGTVDGYLGQMANLRLLFEPTEEQLTELGTISIQAPQTPYRIWL